MIQTAIRALLVVVDDALGSELRAVLQRDDDYGSGGKPSCDWDDASAREALVDALRCLCLEHAALVPGHPLGVPHESDSGPRVVHAHISQNKCLPPFAHARSGGSPSFVDGEGRRAAHLA